MKNKSIELRQEKKDCLEAMKAILDHADSEKRAMTKDETNEYNGLDKKIDALNKEIEGVEGIAIKRANIEAELAEGRQIAEKIHRGDTGGQAVKTGPATRAKDIPGYCPREDQLSEADFWRCLVTKDYGPLASYRAENRGATLGTGAAGGFAVPEVTKLAVLDRLLVDQGLFARIGKEFISEADSLNIASFENCDIDGEGLYGFSTPEFVGEGLTISDESPKLRLRTWSLKKLITHSKISIEAASMGKLNSGMVEAMTGVLKYGLERYIISGSGISQPQGIINASSTLTHGRAGAGAIVYSDIYGMLAKTRLTPGNVWIASQTTIPSLAALVDAGGHAVWMPGVSGGAAQAMPTNLMGFPLIFSLGIQPVLGGKGDIVFASDLAYFKAVLWSDIYVQTSESAHWSTGEIGIRVVMLMDMGALPQRTITVDGAEVGWSCVLSA